MNYLIIIILIINAGVAWFLVRYIAKALKSESGDKEASGGKSGKGELIHDNIMLKNDLKEFSEEVLTKIDRRMSALQKLIKEADDRINTMEVMMPRRREAMGGQPQAPRLPEQEPADGRRANGPMTAKDGKRAAIVRLARKGLSTGEIAQEVGMGRGEVELILNVENSKRNA